MLSRRSHQELPRALWQCFQIMSKTKSAPCQSEEEVLACEEALLTCASSCSEAWDDCRLRWAQLPDHGRRSREQANHWTAQHSCAS